jgi:hypothetical protein
MVAITPNARSTIILGVESENIGIRLWDTESLVSMFGRVVANIDQPFRVSTRIVLRDTEMAILGILARFRCSASSSSSSKGSELTSHLSFNIVETTSARWSSWDTLRHALEFEGPLDGWLVGILRRMATFWNFSIVLP